MRLPEIPGGLFHITTRGNAKATIFHEDRDYEAWLRRLDTTVRDFGWRCHACCVMPNHFHLLVETPQPTRAAGMLVLNGSYARRYNARYTRVGHVFQTPYSAEHVDTDAYFMQASRYIALNPVRAGLRLDPGDWRWSSFRALAGLEPAPDFLCTSFTWRLFESADEYHRFVDAGIQDARAAARARRDMTANVGAQPRW
jgi:REP element-mobilizing transposase RayT